MGQYETFDHLINRLNGMDSDSDRWEFIRENSDLFVVKLDNDDTCVYCIDDDRDEPATGQFNWYVGSSDGVFELLSSIGINAEGV